VYLLLLLLLLVVLLMTCTASSLPADGPTNTDYGVEQSVSVQGLDAAGVDAKLKELAKAGASLPR
jgi:hypothetical protein